MPLLDLKSVSGAAGVLVHFTGGEDLSLHEVSQAAAEITSAAPNADVIFGATVDPVMTGRAQVILVVTGIETNAMEVLKPDFVFRRPGATVAARSEAEDSMADESPMEPQSISEQSPAAAAPEPAGHLAEALFSQAVSAPIEQDQPLVAANSPVADARGSSTGNMAESSLDMPAFLRRRRSLRDYEGAH